MADSSEANKSEKQLNLGMLQRMARRMMQLPRRQPLMILRLSLQTFVASPIPMIRSSVENLGAILQLHMWRWGCLALLCKLNLILGLSAAAC